MKEVGDNYIEGEISVEELAEFLVEEIYVKYPPLLKLFNNDKEEIKNIIKSNINKIKRVPKDREEGIAAKYNLIDREIEIYSKSKIDIEKLRRDNDMMHIIVHESLHAIFTTVRMKKMAVTGCSSNASINKKVVRGVFEHFGNFTGKKNIIKNFLWKQGFYRRINDRCIGDGLNEGFTVWLTEKILGTTMSKKAYPLEKNYVETINDLIGEDKTLKIARGDYKQLAKMLNMLEDEFILFMKSLDVASEEGNKIDLAKDRNDPGDATKQSMYLFNTFNDIMQFVFISRFIIPTYENKIKEEGLTTDNLEMLCCITSRYKGIKEATKYNTERRTHYGEDSYSYLEDFLESKFVEYSNTADVNDLSNTEIMQINGMYDYIFSRLGRNEGVENINKEFIEKVTSRFKSLMEHRKLVNQIGREGISISALTESILKQRRIEEQERKSINRATRRMMRKQDKKNR